jgi:hypothetical protein
MSHPTAHLLIDMEWALRQMRCVMGADIRVWRETVSEARPQT